MFYSLKKKTVEKQRGSTGQNCRIISFIYTEHAYPLVFAGVKNVVLAVHDHLVGDLDKKSGHSLVSVVVSSNSVDHLDGVHQNGEGLDDGQWVSIVKRLDVALEGQEVLNVVLGLVQLLGDSELDRTPVGDSKVDTTISVSVLLIS